MFHFHSFTFECCRKNVPLKKVNSKYILKSTLTPRLARKQFQKNNGGIERSRSWSSLDNGNAYEKDYTSQNYLTIHVNSHKMLSFYFEIIDCFMEILFVVILLLTTVLWSIYFLNYFRRKRSAFLMQQMREKLCVYRSNRFGNIFNRQKSLLIIINKYIDKYIENVNLSKSIL